MKAKPDFEILRLMLDEFWYIPSDVLVRAAEASIFKNLNLKPPVLDIGCGDGRNSLFVFRNKKIDVGLDPDPYSVAEAKKCGIYKKTVEAKVQKLPFKDNSFQTVVSNSVFEHIKEDDRPGVKEIYRVLKKGGFFYLTVPDPTFGLGFGKAKNRVDKKLGHYRYRSFPEWKELLESYGFRVVDSLYYFPESLIKLFYFYFRIANFRPYRRELWSYLKDSPYGKLFPRRLISFLLFLASKNRFKSVFGPGGTLIYIAARKE